MTHKSVLLILPASKSNALSKKIKKSDTGAIGKLHFVKTLSEDGFVSTIQEAFARYIGIGKHAYVPKTRLSHEEAIALIKNFKRHMKTLNALFISLRPKQWIKNMFVFSGILFSHNLTNISMLDKVIAGFIVFCALSGTVYILNDVMDYERDKIHPVKYQRPIASGTISSKTALIFSMLLMFLSLAGSYLLGIEFFLVSALYLTLQVSYSFFLKHIVILDVFTISAGFVLRVFAGALVISVEVSSWLIICTILLSLFLGLSKRRHEIVTLEDNAESHRQVLTKYSSYLLDQMISVITASTLICYALYTMSAETIERFGTNKLIFTVPFVLYGIFRYLYLVHRKGEGGNPELIIISDRPLLINILLWVLAVGLIIYY